MDSSFQIVGGAPDAGAHDVASFHSVLSEDSLSSEEIEADEVSASASRSEVVVFGRLGRSVKTPRLEELEAESEERPPLA
jgi:hypothetical protein